MQSDKKSIILLVTICILILVQCQTSTSVQEKKDTSKSVTKTTIKHMIKDLEYYVTDLADTVTLHTNRIDDRLNTLEDKIDLIVNLLINQEVDRDINR